MLLTVITFVLAAVCIQHWPSGMTIWALVIALLIGEFSRKEFSNLDVYFRKALVYVIPIGMIQAVTNRQVGLK